MTGNEPPGFLARTKARARAVSTRQRIIVGVVVLFVAGSVVAIARWNSDGAIVVAGAATAIATAVLAWVTGRLVATTGRLVESTAQLVTATETMTPSPALVLQLAIDLAGNVFLDLHNAGDGAALDVDIAIEWTKAPNPRITVVLTHTGNTNWRSSVFPAGNRVRFMPPQVAETGHLHGDSLAYFERVTMTGTMHDSRRKPIEVSGMIGDLADIWQFEKDSRRLGPEAYEPDLMVVAQLRKMAELFKLHLPHLASISNGVELAADMRSAQEPPE